jgi:hypothetical protein
MDPGIHRNEVLASLIPKQRCMFVCMTMVFTFLASCEVQTGKGVRLRQRAACSGGFGLDRAVSKLSHRESVCSSPRSATFTGQGAHLTRELAVPILVLPGVDDDLLVYVVGYHADDGERGALDLLSIQRGERPQQLVGAGGAGCQHKSKTVYIFLQRA